MLLRMATSRLCSIVRNRAPEVLSGCSETTFQSRSGKQHARSRSEGEANGQWNPPRGGANIDLRLLGAFLPQGIFPGQRARRGQRWPLLLLRHVLILAMAPKFVNIQESYSYRPLPGFGRGLQPSKVQVSETAADAEILSKREGADGC